MVKLILPGGTRIICVTWHIFLEYDLYCANPAQPLTTAGEELDDLDHDLSEVCFFVAQTVSPLSSRPTPLCFTWHGDVHDDIVCRIAHVGGPKFKQNI